MEARGGSSLRAVEGDEEVEDIGLGSSGLRRWARAELLRLGREAGGGVDPGGSW